MNKYVLITGSNGLVGSETAKFFLEKNYKIIGIDNNKRKFFFGVDADTNWIKKRLLLDENYFHYNIDVTNYKELEKIFKKFLKKISLIVHCAAQPSHDWAYKNPILDFDINSKSTLYLLELMKIYSSNSKFILTSTNKLYGDNPNKLPLIEKSKRYEIKKNHKYFKGIKESMSIDNCKHSLFGASKAYGDLITQEYGKNFGLDTIVFRAGCITGPNHSGVSLHGFLSFLVKSCVEKKKYTIIGHKGKQVRDNIHSYDLVKCFWEFYKSKNNKKGEVYNIGGGRKSNCSIIEAIDYIEKKISIKIKKIFLSKSRIGDHVWYITNNAKFLKSYPKWKQEYNYKKIIDEIIDSIK